MTDRRNSIRLPAWPVRHGPCAEIKEAVKARTHVYLSKRLSGVDREIIAVCRLRHPLTGCCWTSSLMISALVHNIAHSREYAGHRKCGLTARRHCYLLNQSINQKRIKVTKVTNVTHAQHGLSFVWNLQADDHVASADFVQELCKSGQNDTKLSRFVESFTGCAELSFSCVRTKCQNTTENASTSSKRSHFMESGCVASAGWNMLIVAPPLYVLGSLHRWPGLLRSSLTTVIIWLFIAQVTGIRVHVYTRYSYHEIREILWNANYICIIRFNSIIKSNLEHKTRHI